MQLRIKARVAAYLGLPILAMTSLMLTGCGGGGASDKIIRVSRQNNSGTYVYFREAVLGKQREYKLGSLDKSGSKDVVDQVATTPLAIGYSGMGYATDDVKMLTISKEKGGAAVAPTVESAQSGAYLLARPLYVYTVGQPTGAVKHFIDWSLSSEGQAVVTDVGYVPVDAVEPPADQAVPDGETIKVAGSDTMVNLAAAWAEKYMAKYPGVDVQISGGGSGTGFAKLIDGTIGLANASRDMKDAEKKEVAEKQGQEPVEFTMALDALAVYVHKDNPLDTISLDELAEIYGDGGTITTWSQVEGWPQKEN